MWDAAFADWWWLDRYGITPDQVEAMPLNTQHRVPLIQMLADEYAEEQAKRR